MIRDIRAHLRELIDMADGLDGALATIGPDGLPPLVAARTLVGIVDMGDRLFEIAEPLRSWRCCKRRA